jgi:hydrogenase assembly chaperone HypC/HupF
MCLGEVGRVCAVTDLRVLTVELGGREVIVSGALLDGQPAIGGWVLVHAGFAVGHLTEPEARAALETRHEAEQLR